ncbi:hypothetical protein LSTR_LSTR007583 [Laodelphax striatellus]|uniref:Uncharacterized protein n=1 Tax=Laodelphax striatellus TaxID=195883 RepID=A0A482WID4_LAOST|nr:hypothetical protein LSTR_LSTR007583 [Laodelphax striatellus]
MSRKSSRPNNQNLYRVAWFDGTGRIAVGASAIAPFLSPRAITGQAALASLREWLTNAKRLNGADKKAARLPRAGRQAASWLEGVEELPGWRPLATGGG